jgi:hypothetical protein
VSLPLFPEGDGIIVLSLSGALPLFPSWVYGLLELGALAGAVARGTGVAQPRHPCAGLVLSYAPLMMAWRSAGRYFFLLPIAAVAVVVLTQRQAASARAAARQAQAAIPPMQA